MLDELALLASRYREVSGTATLTAQEAANLDWRISRLDAVGSALRSLAFQLEGPAPPNSSAQRRDSWLSKAEEALSVPMHQHAGSWR